MMNPMIRAQHRPYIRSFDGFNRPGLGWKSSSPIFGSTSRSGRATSRSAGRTPAAGLRPAHPRPLARDCPGHRSARSDQHLSETCRVVKNDGVVTDQLEHSSMRDGAG